MPVSAAAAEVKILKTNVATITINDEDGSEGVTIETVNLQRVKLTAAGIEIDNGMGATIKLSGPTVTINQGAFEVT